MKKYLLILVFILPIFVNAQTIVLSDNFDSYTAGNPLAANSPLWITWTGSPSEDANVSSTQSNSPANSVYIIGNNGPTDLVLPFPSNYTSGIYELTMKIFVVTGNGAYFNLQGSMTPGVNWMLEVYFNSAGGGTINAGGTGTALFSYNPNTWNDIKVNVSLTNDVAQFFINSNLIYSWAWSLASNGLGAPIMWGGLNLYAAASAPGNAEYYIDDIVLTDVTPTGIDENSPFTGIQIFPNPACDYLSWRLSPSYINYSTATLTNALGQTIFTKDLILPGVKYHFNMNQVEGGIYFLNVQNGNLFKSEKIIVVK
ncbi:MAG: T9SS type A sorting domain-containing protein [Bacteroidia bacterium]|nr:T9SS type A sorting domain-containing protein [Bacteroidia bacterium]